MKQESGVKKPTMTVQVIARRKRVLERLEKQLILGKKVQKIFEGSKIAIITAPLNEKDITRIEKEIIVLKSRV